MKDKQGNPIIEIDMNDYISPEDVLENNIMKKLTKKINSKIERIQ